MMIDSPDPKNKEIEKPENKIKSTIFWIFFYLVLIIPIGLSVLYLSEKNILPAFITLFVLMSAYTFLVIKNIKILSLISFFTIFPISLLMLGIAGQQTDGIFLYSIDEKLFMLTNSLINFFILINSVFLIKTKKGFIKIFSFIIIFICILMLISFGIVLPAYYQNFVYTRINILILLIFSFYLLKIKRKILGVLGILLSIGLLLFSAGEFAQKTYILSENEHKEVIAFIEPKAKEMFESYNQKDYNNFCKDCGITLNNLLIENPIGNNRETWGPYIYFDEPSQSIRKAGLFYIEYPAKFQNVEDPVYITFTMENISPDSKIYGFAFSTTPQQEYNKSEN